MRRKLFLIFITAAIGLFVIVGSFRSQIRTRVDLVVVPVSVRDNNGFLVTGLDRDDFQIFEDGKRQEIVNFSMEAEPLSVAIVVDDGMSGTALKRLIPLLPSATAAFTPQDEMASFRYDHFVSRLSDFTTDHDQILKSFHELPDIAITRPDEPQQPQAISTLERKTPGWIKALASIFNVGSNGAPSSLPTTPAPKPAPESRLMHSAIFDAAMALQSRPDERRRIIFLISDGVVAEPQISVVPGKTLHSFNQNVEMLIKDKIQVFSIYALAGLLETSKGMLNSYAEATGGDVYGGRSESDMKFAMNRILEQARTQYVLGYLSSNTPPPQGIFRTIEVKTGDPSLKRRVVHRTGYFQNPIPK